MNAALTTLTADITALDSRLSVEVDRGVYVLRGPASVEDKAALRAEWT